MATPLTLTLKAPKHLDVPIYHSPIHNSSVLPTPHHSSLATRPLRTLSSRARETPLSVVTGVNLEQQLTTSGYAVDDFNFKTPEADLLAAVSRNNGRLNMYEYPGRYLTQEAGAARAQLLLQSAELPQTRLPIHPH